MTITEALNNLYEELEEDGINLGDYGIYDEEDLIVFALNYLCSNLDNAFDYVDEDSEEPVAL